MRANIFWLTLSLIFLSGCVKENRDDCPDTVPDYNFILRFAYTDPDGKEKDGNGNYLFDEKIDRLDVIFYDARQELYRFLPLYASQLDTDRCARLKVDPGTYYIVGWANNENGRSTMPILTYGDASLGENIIKHNHPETADPLFYAPDKRRRDIPTYGPDFDEVYAVTVAAAGITEHTLPFMGAHRTLNIFLRNFPDVMSSTTSNPDVAVDGLPEDYDDYLHTGEDMLRFTTGAVNVIVEDEKGNQEEFGYASFTVPHFENTSPVNVAIAGFLPHGPAYSHTVSMDKILQELGLTVYDGDEAVIDIIIELDGAYVKVITPPWKVINIKPGF